VNEEIKTYEFIVYDEDGVEVFRAKKPSLEYLLEEIGRFERHFKEIK
jgi:hypothetical protein